MTSVCWWGLWMRPPENLVSVTLSVCLCPSLFISVSAWLCGIVVSWYTKNHNQTSKTEVKQGAMDKPINLKSLSLSNVYFLYDFSLEAFKFPPIGRGHIYDYLNGWLRYQRWFLVPAQNFRNVFRNASNIIYDVLWRWSKRSITFQKQNKRA